MASKWKKAVWDAVQRRARSGLVTREALIDFELPRIIAEVGSVGQTPHQTLSRELQELRDAGVLIFDGKGCYRVSSGLTGKEIQEAVATEIWRFQKARLGQGAFRRGLIKHWKGRCAITGIVEIDLLRASHIIPWNRCESESDRLDSDNGLLLSPLWDAAFDRGLVSFDDEGKTLYSIKITNMTLKHMKINASPAIGRLTDGHRRNLAWHRNNHWQDR